MTVECTEVEKGVASGKYITLSYAQVPSPISLSYKKMKASDVSYDILVFC